MSLEVYKEFAQHLAEKAGQVILSGKEEVRVVKQKDVRDIATNVDLEAEKLIVELIRAEYPEHSVFSEEQGLSGPKSEYQWIIDPLDGTKQYLRNLPNFSCNICLTFKEKAIVSVVYFPLFKRLYSAAEGLGAFVDGRKTKMSPISKLEEA